MNLAGVVGIAEAGDGLVGLAVAAAGCHRGMGKLVEGGAVIFFRNLVLAEHRHDYFVKGRGVVRGPGLARQTVSQHTGNERQKLPSCHCKGSEGR